MNKIQAILRAFYAVYSVALPYREVDDTKTGVAAKEARALCARKALISQNEASRPLRCKTD